MFAGGSTVPARVFLTDSHPRLPADHNHGGNTWARNMGRFTIAVCPWGVPGGDAALRNLVSTVVGSGPPKPSTCALRFSACWGLPKPQLPGLSVQQAGHFAAAGAPVQGCLDRVPTKSFVFLVNVYERILSVMFHFGSSTSFPPRGRVGRKISRTAFCLRAL